MPHTCGSKSIARKKHEMEMESGGPVSRGAIFVATHKKRDGSFVNDYGNHNNPNAYAPQDIEMNVVHSVPPAPTNDTTTQVVIVLANNS
ncbi:uncharacterized protein G2W53_010461 [Senna tora]|uniref:Uncharacterized protein n=1 Tax=Senna tora TaxID=362788 RepID=A0A834X109_9FABA|nr:uncharacterized protein G2W53_010461 [Senna tora]